ncbi:MAG: hypothetical protein LBH06_04745, partial [Rikenellaceae bacterium]|nr:hypothetical protein [Rikenellaceae bacterium]
LELDMNGMSTVSASSREYTATVKFRTNVVWKAETLGATWLTVGESTATPAFRFFLTLPTTALPYQSCPAATSPPQSPCSPPP